MQVAEAFPKTDIVSDLPIDLGALYLLSGKNVSPAIRHQAVDRAKAGERITKHVAASMVGQVVADEPDESKTTAGALGAANAAAVSADGDEASQPVTAMMPWDEPEVRQFREACDACSDKQRAWILKHVLPHYWSGAHIDERPEALPVAA
jgi:hypothetical protein